MGRKKNTVAVLRESLRQKGRLNKTYSQRVAVFCQWAKAHDLKTATLEQVADHIPDYIAYRQGCGLSDSTVHTDVAALCTACGVSMGNYTTIHRGQPHKGRTDARNDRTEANARVVDFAQRVGIRKREYAHLRGNDYIQRDSDLYVIVRKGKGGKYQEQYIRPEDRDFVLSYFTDSDDTIFTTDEMKSCKHANLHGIRRSHAQEMYDYYVQLFKDHPEERDHMKDRLQGIFDRNPMKAGHFDRDLMDRPYTARGNVRKELQDAGRPVTFDRLALMAVSVLHLSHYREDVTVKNYMK